MVSLTAAVTLITGLGWAGTVKGKGDSVCAQANAIVATLADISGLSQRKAVECSRFSHRQLHRFIVRRIKDSTDPAEIHADELALKLFGFVPPDFDLKKTTIDLLTEQAAAFYDYKEKKLVLLDSVSVAAEEMTLAHELSHALADQHFNLEKFTQDGPTSDDADLAHTAVVEGEASWLMLAYEMKRQGGDPEPSAEMLRALEGSSASSLASYPVLSHAPLFIRQSLLFPYAEGTRFFGAVHRRLGREAFGTVFERPPRSSAQVLHPERYLAKEEAVEPELPAVPVPDAHERVAAGSVGEFDEQILLRQYVSDDAAATLAPHLVAGRFAVSAAGPNRQPVLRYLSRWDSTGAAIAYFSAYRTVLRHKWQRMEVSVDERRQTAGRGDNGYFVTWLDNTSVVSYEGLDTVEALQQVLAHLAGHVTAGPHPGRAFDRPGPRVPPDSPSRATPRNRHGADAPA